jgi:hypothetical protein
MMKKDKYTNMVKCINSEDYKLNYSYILKNKISDLPFNEKIPYADRLDFIIEQLKKTISEEFEITEDAFIDRITNNEAFSFIEHFFLEVKVLIQIHILRTKLEKTFLQEMNRDEKAKALISNTGYYNKIITSLDSGYMALIMIRDGLDEITLEHLKSDYAKKAVELYKLKNKPKEHSQKMLDARHEDIRKIISYAIELFNASKLKSVYQAHKDEGFIEELINFADENNLEWTSSNKEDNVKNWLYKAQKEGKLKTSNKNSVSTK